MYDTDLRVRDPALDARHGDGLDAKQGPGLDASRVGGVG